MTELNLIHHIVSRLEPQVQDYVEFRNPTTRATLLQMISKFEERYSCRETQGSRMNFNRERRCVPNVYRRAQELKLEGRRSYESTKRKEEQFKKHQREWT
ncbi:hypothetical protein TNCV_3592341 [Trichonephila clavipes]|nr:hypothetical protein TNCV_3592341 [Trichonephila clavipes]